MRREGSAKLKANPKGLLNAASRATPGLEGEVVGLCDVLHVVAEVDARG